MRRAAGRREDVRNALAGLAVLGLTALVAYVAFNPSDPLHKPFELRAVVRSASQLRTESPVRIAGVQVGRVDSIEAGPGRLTTVVMRLQDRALPLHDDAELRIRPRLFLEGGFYVELQPGSPSAPEVRSGWRVPVSRTSTPVQLYQALDVFDAPAREALRTQLDVLARATAHGGAEGLHEAAPQLAPLLRDVSVAADALRGPGDHALSDALRSGARLLRVTGDDAAGIARLVASFDRAAGALAAHDRQLGAAVTALDGTLRDAPPALRALDAALPESRHTLASLSAALPAAPRALRRTLGVVGQLDALVAPATRDRTIAALATTFRDLPTLVGRLASMFPTAKPLADCLSSHVIPILNAKAPDGKLSSGRPVWQDFVHAMVGLASASQNFDANGYATRYMFGTGPDMVSTESLPGIGRLVGSIGTPLQSRPVPLAAGRTPPVRTDQSCAAQPVPSLAAPAGSSGLRSAGGRSR
jgi:virulence factor Mce-like protein